MRLHIISIIKNGQPWVERHLPIFEATGLDWTWHISEGTADNVLDTSWCAKPEPGLSTDGTTAYLNSISTHPRVRLYRKDLWAGKLEMIQASRPYIGSDCVVFTVDVDEEWRSEDIVKMVRAFERKHQIMSARFWCTFLLGPKIKAVTQSGWSNRPTEWHRMWRGRKSARWQSHEPPVYDSNRGLIMDRDETKALGIQFLHHAYELRSQLVTKERSYQYPGAVAQWESLQKNTKWPLENLSDYLSWVGPNVGADIYTGPEQPQ
jgi:hypothetical protein